jgi:hypothetical protein
VDFDKAATDLQCGKVLSSDWTQSEQCHHQPIANLLCSRKLAHTLRVFGLVYEGQSGFDESLGRDQAVKLRARPRHKRQILTDFGKPGEIAARGHILGGTPQHANRGED